MRIKTTFLKLFVLAIVFGFVFHADGFGITDPTAAEEVYAGTKTVNEPGLGCKSGRYIYYAFEMEGIRMGIMRYDTKTGKKKEIFSYQKNGNGTNGFYELSLKGKYLYAVWDTSYGTSASTNYIYRIAIDGSSSKKLACGIHPVIVGNRIYYEKCKLVKDDWEQYTESTGKSYSMKLDGTDKKKAKYPVVKTLSGSTWGSTAGTDTVKGYRYYIAGNSLYRKNVKNGKEKKLMTCKNGITEFYVCGSYILVRGSITPGSSSWSEYDLAAYIIDTSGKNKKKLASWAPAE